MAFSGTGSYATTRYALELDSQISGLLNDFEGGDATADVVAERPDPGGIVHKRLANVRYEDIALQIDGTTQSGGARIAALTINRDFASDLGVSRESEMRPGALNMPNVAFTIAESDADWLRTWHADFVIHGHNGAGNEKSGTL